MRTGELLKSKGIRSTNFRQDLLRVFMKYENAITNEEIEKELGDFDRITLYRTLKSFKEKGLIHEITIPEEPKRYALCNDCSLHEHDHQHIHFQCDQCNTVYCIEPKQYPKIEIPNFIIHTTEIQVKGICEKCN